jgi:hypothetical protein
VCSPKGEAPEAVSPKVFLNIKRTHEYRNLPFRKQLSFYFLTSFLDHRKGISPWEHIKVGELLQHNTLGFFCCGRSLKIHMK